MLECPAVGEGLDGELEGIEEVEEATLEVDELELEADDVEQVTLLVDDETVDETELADVVERGVELELVSTDVLLVEMLEVATDDEARLV